MTSTFRPPTTARALPGLGSDASPRREPYVRIERRWTRIAFIGIGVVTALGVIIMLVTGNPWLAQAPAEAAVLAYLFWTQPARRIATFIVFAQFLAFAPPFGSGVIYWGFLRPANDIFNGLLNKVTGIGALSFTGIEFLFLCLFMLLAIREVRNQRIDAEGRVEAPRVLFAFLGLELLAVLVLELYGVVTGGNAKLSIFQLRPFIFLPLQTLVFSYAFRSSRDFMRLAGWVTLAAALKIAFGLYFINKDVWQQGIESPYMTTHGDTVLFVAVTFAWFAAWAHQHSWQRLVQMLVVVSWMILGIVVNDRRLAWVSLVASLVVFYTTVNGLLRRRVNLALIFLSPLIVLYFAIATKVSTGLFAPGAELMGMANTTDDSSQWRILENQNLVWNLHLHRFIGSGFGKEWIEVFKLPDVSNAFKEYRLVAHNSVLWILQLSGIFGFTFIWMPIMLGVFFAARSYRCAQSAMERTCAATVMAMILCYVNQAWGDVGIADPLNTMMLALALTLAGKLAHETGAWSPHARLIAR